MKICIFSGIFPPEVGGPSFYAFRLFSDLKRKGFLVKVVTYSDIEKKVQREGEVVRISKKYPKLLSYFLCFLYLLKEARDCDLIYSFALTTIGMPPYLASKILRKKFVIRLGGDFLWERAIEEGRTEKGLLEYYKEPKILKERFFSFLLKRVLRGADKIIFTTIFQKELYKKYFNVQEEKIVIIENPFPKIGLSQHKLSATDYQILYAGRLIKLKNLDVLIDAFSEIYKKINFPLILKIIGNGPERENLEARINNLEIKDKIVIQKSRPHHEILKEIEKSYLCVLLSTTAVSPNFVLECIKLKKPILVTKETGFYEKFKNDLIFVNPRDKKELKERIVYLLDKNNYQNYKEKIERIDTFYSWEEVVEKHISLFRKLI